MSANRAQEEDLSLVQSGGSAADPARRRDWPCPRCYGTGLEVVAGKGARRCDCRRAGLRRGLLNAARIPRRYESCTFQNYRPAQGNGSQLPASKSAFRLLDEYPAVERGLLFTGLVGTGKTHLSVAILRGLIEKGVPGLFYNFGALTPRPSTAYLTRLQGALDTPARVSPPSRKLPV